MAASVDSVPELVKRHSGSPKRRASSAATGMMSGTGWAKWVPGGDAVAHRGDDRRVGVAGDHRAEAAVQVDVLVAVDVPHPGPGAALDEHRARRGVLPRRGHAAGQVGGRLDVQLVGAPGAGDQRRLLRRDQRVEGVEAPRGVGPWSTSAICDHSLLTSSVRKRE